MIKAAIFDVGGVLHTHSNARIIDDISFYFALPRSAVEAQWAKLTPLLGRGDITEPEFWKRFQAGAGVNKPLPAESLFLRGLRDTYQLNQEMIYYINELKQRGLKLAILSNTITVHADFLRHQGVYAKFEVAVLSHEVGLHKPDPRIFTQTLEKLGTAASETVMIDDSAANIEAAKALGLQGIVYTDMASFKPAMQDLLTA